jgi:putative sterol carrier protein
MTAKNFKYLSKEWAAEVEKQCKKQLTPEKMKHITSSMLTVYTNCPDKKSRALFYKLVNGKVDSITLVEGTLPKAEFTITADYEIFARISRAELKARAALMSGKMNLKGNLVKALTLSPTVDRLNEVLASVPTDY